MRQTGKNIWYKQSESIRSRMKRFFGNIFRVPCDLFKLHFFLFSYCDKLKKKIFKKL